MNVSLALYKGPPTSLLHKVTHYITRLFTWSKYSHAELVIDGVCYSSSARDGGVRAKVIDVHGARWDVFELDLPIEVAESARLWFELHEEDLYDYRNLIRYVFPGVGHNKNQWVCYEAVGAALGISRPHMLTAETLLKEAKNLRGLK